jgi:transposase
MVTDTAHEKATLFCPECGHASAPDGDWRVTERRSRRIYECPTCDHTLDSRRRYDPVPA